MTVTYPMLGRNGRLGNTLFQVAATAGTALARGEPWCLPLSALEPDACPSLARFKNLAPYFGDELPEGPTYREPRFAYDPIQPEVVRLHGYFQSSRYWRGHEDEVRRLLSPGTGTWYPVGQVAAIHVRRGDYTKLADFHTNLGLDYYKPAMDLLRLKGFDRFRVFSDDPDFSGRFLQGRDIEIMLMGDQVDDMIQFSACSAHVIANSSWSWWGAYLGGPGKPVVAPRRWFGPRGPAEWQDLYEEGWEVL